MHQIEKGDIPPAVNMTGGAFVEDSMGNIRLDICWTCRTNMSLSGEEVVN